MNATTASATTAPTMNATVCIGFWTRGRRNTSVFRHDLKTARIYARKKAREGYVIGSAYVWTDSDGTKCANVHLIPRAHYNIITPGYQECEVINHRDGSKFAIMAYEERDCFGDVFIYRECADIPAPAPEPVQYGVRTIVNGVIEDWTRYDTELDARDNAQTIVDSDTTGNTHATIIPIMPDGTLGGVLDVIRYEPPTENTDWMFPDDVPNLTVRIWDPRTGRTDVEIDVSDLDDARAIVHHYNRQVFYSIIDEIDGALLESGEYFPDFTQGAN